MIKNFILITSLFSMSFILQAQDSRTVDNTPKNKQSFDAYNKQSMERWEAFKNHPINLYYDRLIVEYEERMIANVKKYKVMARKMKKPQYSDPSYFGHKRKPKKRPVGKRKYCKECEIVH